MLSFDVKFERRAFWCFSALYQAVLMYPPVYLLPVRERLVQQSIARTVLVWLVDLACRRSLSMLLTNNARLALFLLRWTIHSGAALSLMALQ